MATRDFEWISSICEKDGFEVEKVKKSTEYLFENYYKAKIARELDRPVITDDEVIMLQQQKIRHEFLHIITEGGSKEEYNKLIWDALSISWIDERIQMLLEEMTEYSDVGPLYRNILEETYLKKKQLTNEDLYAACGMGKTAYYERKKEAVVLFGVLLWKFAHGRELEDIAKGIIEPTDKLSA